MPRIAEIDRAILAQLRKNGRMSYVDLASRVEASERTVRTHIRNMEENGTIRGYTIREGGVGLTALVRIKVSPGSEIGSFASEVTGWEGVEIVYEVSGEADLVALVHVDDTMALRAPPRQDVARSTERDRQHHHGTGLGTVLSPTLPRTAENNQCRRTDTPCCRPSRTDGGTRS